MVQRDLLALMKSKPTAFRGQEARDIMDDISPVLLDLAEMSLIARQCLKLA